MEDVANGWKAKVRDAGGNGGGVGWGVILPMEPSLNVDETVSDDDSITTEVELDATVISSVNNEYEYDDEGEDIDEDDLDDYIQMMAESRAAMQESRGVPSSPPSLYVDNTSASSVISPFQTNSSTSAPNAIPDGEPLELTMENVDKVLDEVRPYLISDGGNVSVPRVDAETGNVYLLLEGACGSCASSTVTMKMGIERVLKEKFGERLGEVIQVDPKETEEEAGKLNELTIEAVQAEINRISAAIVAMGGVVRVVSVDPIGVVEIEFRGPNKVKKGLELALLDVDFVKHVKFVS